MQIRSFFSALPIVVVFAVLALADFFYQYNIRHQSLWNSFFIASLDGMLYTLILWMTTRLDLARVTITYLALPYIFFIPGWLNIPTALLLSVVLVISLWHVLRHVESTRLNSISWHELTAFMLVLCWINMSGAGGYGWQTQDWEMHNARMHDLITFAWPIRYGENQNLVYYVGYFLPSAIIGKLTSVDMGLRSLFPWTVLGVTLAIRWLSVLSQWRFTLLLAFVFIAFGPLDIINVQLMHMLPMGWNTNVAEALTRIDLLNFRSSYNMGFFLGNYLSNSFQLFWSPQQVIAGWLCMGLLSYGIFQAKHAINTSSVFIYALLCLWGPLVMIALLPFVATTFLLQMRNDWRSPFGFHNIIGAGTLAFVFVIFYTSGSTSQNLSLWVPGQLYMLKHYIVLFLFYLTAWGIYVLMIAPAVTTLHNTARWWFFCLVASLLALPLYLFGDYADLLCRGSAPLMFLLLVYALLALRHYWQQRRPVKAVLLSCLLILGSGSAYQHFFSGWHLYGRTQPVRSITDYSNAFPNLGPDQSRFEQWFRKPLP